MKKLVKESLNEDMGQRMSVDEFHTWFSNLYAEYDYADLDWEFLLSVLSNDEESSDEELADYLRSEINFELIEEPNTAEEFFSELISKRDYFLDFRYVKDIEI